MRRGKLTNANLILIIMVAIFTLLSFISDQWVIRKEDDLRQVNIKYNNTLTKIQSYNSLRHSLLMLGIRANILIDSYLFKRNLWIKGLILAESDKKHGKLFTARKLNYKWDLKYYLTQDLVDMFIYTKSLRDELYHIRGWLDPVFIKDMGKSEKIHKKLDGIFYLDEVFKENIDEFFFKNEKFYDNALRDIDDARSKALNSFKLKNWVDINRYTILCAESLFKDSKHLEDYVDYFDKLVLDNEETLNGIFIKQKEITLLKSSLILISILTQILALLFLLFLFRNMIKHK